MKVPQSSAMEQAIEQTYSYSDSEHVFQETFL